jgi:hypothetical protein
MDCAAIVIWQAKRCRVRKRGIANAGPETIVELATAREDVTLQ